MCIEYFNKARVSSLGNIPVYPDYKGCKYTGELDRSDDCIKAHNFINNQHFAVSAYEFITEDEFHAVVDEYFV